MNINRRLESLEQKAGGSEPLIVFFRTVYESKDGGVEDEYFRASVTEGPYTGTHVVRDGNETFEDFKMRVRSIANGEISRQAAD